MPSRRSRRIQRILPITLFAVLFVTESGAGAVPGQTVSVKRIDPHTAERTTWLKGKKLTTEKWEISSDGKTRTVTQSGVDLAGKPVDNVVVYEKK